MAIQLGSAYGKVGLDVKGLLSAVTQGKAGLQSLASVGESVGAGMKRAGQAMTIGLTLPILAAGAASIKAASDLEETRNKVKVVFGDMSDSVLAWSQDSARAFGLSRQQALEAAGTFGNLFTSMGLNRGPAAEMSQGLVQMAADLASFNNIDPSIVLEKLRSGLVGEVEPLRTLGINLTMAATKQKALEMGLADANGTVSQAALLQARYALILEQTVNAQGDFARTSDGLANSTRIMNAQFKDALATLGANLLPMALKVVSALNSMLQAFNNMSPFQQKMVLGFLAMVAAMGPVLVVLGMVISFVSTLIGFTSSLAGMGISLAGIGAALGTAGTAIVGVGTALLPVIGIVLAVVAVVGLLYWAWKKNLFGIQDILAKSAAGYRQAWERFTTWWEENTQTAGANVQATFAGMGPNIQSAFQRFGTSASAGWASFMSWLRNALLQARNYIANAFSNVNWGTLGKNILMGLANGMLLGLPNLLGIAKKIADALLKQIKAALGIRSPSSEAMKLGMFTAQGFQLGLQKVSPEDMARSLARPITGGSTSTQQTIVQNFASGLTVSQARQMIAENNEALINTMVTALSG